MRRSFLPLIPEISQCADLLSNAVDAVLRGNDADARALLKQADMPALRIYTERVIGKIDPAIHLQSSNPVFDREILGKSDKRMPSRKAEHEVYVRDGWRCRYCGSRVVAREARARLNKLFPVEARWARANAGRHSGLFTLSVSLDHILPHSRGGSNLPDNLVTACTPCQFGRNQWTLEEVGFAHPRLTEPLVNDWDGLLRIIGHEKRTTPP